MAERPLRDWADRLEHTAAACPRLGIRSVRVLAETTSTQDAAWEAGRGSAGWLVVTGRQRAGRGRLGRAWQDTGHAGLAMTLALPAGALHSVAAGLAVCRGLRGLVAQPEGIGLRWPNDVVERGRARKVAGVLIEVRTGVALVGIGVNVAQREEDFGDLAARAASLRQLGGTADRLETAQALLRQLDRVIAEEPGAIAQEAAALDTLLGTRQRLTHDGREFTGTITALAPDGAIDLELDSGQTISLPTDTTSRIHD